MTDTLYPVNAVGGAPANSGRMLRQAGSVALAGATAARPLGARSGVRPGTSTTTVTATSTTWTCGPFAGVADVQAAAEAAPYNFAFDAPTSGGMAAANASYARTDILYVQLDDPSESDGSAVPAVTRKYLAGQAVAGQPTPAPPVSRAMVVARINVPIAGGGSPVVTWVAPYAVAAGGILPVISSSQYPASPRVGDCVDDLALGFMLRWNGTAWKGIAGELRIGSVTTAGGIWTLGAVSVVKSPSGLVTVNASVTKSYAISDGNIGMIIGAGFRPLVPISGAGASALDGAAQPCYVSIGTNGEISVYSAGAGNRSYSVSLSYMGA